MRGQALVPFSGGQDSTTCLGLRKDGWTRHRPAMENAA